MDLQCLKWTKNVRRTDGQYAYREYQVSDPFKLAWKDKEDNANRPDREDLILLRQYGYVTHLVKVLDDRSQRESWQGDFNIYRIVQVLWTIDCSNPPESAKADIIFDYPVRYQGGDVMNLVESKTFQVRWGSKGGLPAFQDRVRAKLSALI